MFFLSHEIYGNIYESTHFDICTVISFVTVNLYFKLINIKSSGERKITMNTYTVFSACFISKFFKNMNNNLVPLHTLKNKYIILKFTTKIVSISSPKF